jgi:hypothetical protein
MSPRPPGSFTHATSPALPTSSSTATGKPGRCVASALGPSCASNTTSRPGMRRARPRSMQRSRCSRRRPRMSAFRRPDRVWFQIPALLGARRALPSLMPRPLMYNIVRVGDSLLSSVLVAFVSRTKKSKTEIAAPSVRERAQRCLVRPRSLRAKTPPPISNFSPVSAQR